MKTSRNSWELVNVEVVILRLKPNYEKPKRNYNATRPCLMTWTSPGNRSSRNLKPRNKRKNEGRKKKLLPGFQENHKFSTWTRTESWTGRSLLIYTKFKKRPLAESNVIKLKTQKLCLVALVSRNNMRRCTLRVMGALWSSPYVKLP